MTNYENRVWRKVIPRLVDKMRKAILENDIIVIAVTAKLIIEYISQIKYLIDKFGHNEDKFQLDIKRRTRKGQSFSIRMITDAKGIPGPIKKYILSVYLHFAKYVHPSEDLTFILTSDRDVQMYVQKILQEIHKLLDVTLYIYIAMYGASADLCALCYDISLEKCLKKCKHRA